MQARALPLLLCRLEITSCIPEVGTRFARHAGAGNVTHVEAGMVNNKGQ